MSCVVFFYHDAHVRAVELRPLYIDIPYSLLDINSKFSQAMAKELGCANMNDSFTEIDRVEKVVHDYTMFKINFR